MSSNFINVPRLHSYCAPLSNNNLIFCILLFLFLRTFHNKNYCKKYSNELTLCHKLWFSNPNIFGTQCRKPLIFRTYIFWFNKSHSLKFQRFTTSESNDIWIRKSEFVAKSLFLSDFISLLSRMDTHRLQTFNSKLVSMVENPIIV